MCMNREPEDDMELEAEDIRTCFDEMSELQIEGVMEALDDKNLLNKKGEKIRKVFWEKYIQEEPLEPQVQGLCCPYCLEKSQLNFHSIGNGWKCCNCNRKLSQEEVSLVRKESAKRYYQEKTRQDILSKIKDRNWNSLKLEEMKEIIKGGGENASLD